MNKTTKGIVIDLTKKDALKNISPRDLFQYDNVEIKTVIDNGDLWFVDDYEIQITFTGQQLQYLCECWHYNLKKKDGFDELIKSVISENVVLESCDYIEEFLSAKKQLKNIIKIFESRNFSSLSENDIGVITNLFNSMISEDENTTIHTIVQHLDELRYGFLEKETVV